MGSKERRQREKDNRRQQIQDAATVLILEKGYQGTKIEDIANKIELTPGALYRHFKNKDELFASLLIVPLELLYAKIEEMNEAAVLSPEEKILGLKEAMYETYQSHPVMVRCIIHIQLEKIMVSLEPELASQIDDINRKIIGFMLGVFNDGISEGKFVPGEEIVYADMCWVMFAGLILWEEAKRELNPKKDYLKSTLDQSFDVFLAGIRKN